MGNFAEIKNKLKSLMSGSTEFVGLDIGSHSVKAVCVSGYEKHFRLKSWGISPLAIKPEADPEEKKFLTSVAIKEMLSKSGINNKYVALSVSGNSVIVRYVTLPKTDKANLRLVLASEAEPFIPFDIKDVNLSAHIIGDKNEEGQKKMEIVLVAAKKDLLRNRMDGETIVIGGLIYDSVSDTVYKVPLLGDIPILGWLFKKKANSRQRIELLIFVTPRIVNG